MPTQYYTACSLDGFIATADDSLDWLFQPGDVNDTGYPRFISEVGALTMGSNTYRWILRHVVEPGGAAAWPYAQPAWVFTGRSLPAVTGADVRFVQGDVRPVHAQIRRRQTGTFGSWAEASWSAIFMTQDCLTRSSSRWAR